MLGDDLVRCCAMRSSMIEHLHTGNVVVMGMPGELSSRVSHLHNFRATVVN